MKPTIKEVGDRREAERHAPPAERKTEIQRSLDGDRRVEGAVGAAMVDALEDILRWERASERSVKVAPKVEATDLPN